MQMSLEQAAFLAEDASTPWSHFEDPENMGNATEAVWSNAEGFRAEAENFEAVTANLSAAAQTATSMEDIKPAFSEVGASCKSCHTEFRAKNE